MARLNEIPFVKGHGTGNDFVIIPDVDGHLDLTPEQVRWLCDRRHGIGGDGVLRVVRTEHVPGFEDFAPVAEFFMDYRNGDGSVAEMCGNGARVFVRYLDATGLVTDNEVVIATRGGMRSTTINPDRSITIDMGIASTPRARALPHVTVGEQSWPATGVLIPNPHAVVFVSNLDEAGDLATAPSVTPVDVFPEGVNVEFVVPVGERHVAMRVHERGVGETLSCGTGACAVAWAARRHDEADAHGETTWQVDVPGGTVQVTETAAGALLLTGPADLVARGTVLLPF
ncbi:MAG: diaminopimelate epimerase [Actinomycetales bacterium]|nr:diaminopimelate epimerase [Actinomycetales bacterium]